jgi:DtxR family Mn-dependent transcriptional regulator
VTLEVSSAVQDYAKAIYSLEQRCDGGAVSTNALAERMGVSAASASSMVKKLDGLGIVEHVPYRGVALTERGMKVALEVLRHHRLLERFLAEELGVPWDRVHDEAEVLEHVLSEELEELIAVKLGHPTIDPHGDPIPTKDLEIVEGATVGMDELEIGEIGRLVRVSDSDPEMLRYLSARGIAPGDDFAIIDKQPFGGPIFARFGDDPDVHPLGGRLAAAMRVEVEVESPVVR